jgi:DnaJ-class molecular chaperone
MCQPDEDYELWCELNPCPDCDGVGTIEGDFLEHTCQRCAGSGIDPEATYEG